MPIDSARQTPPRTVSGILLIDKPAGITSFDIIRRLRRQTGIRKIGHAGTLDPLATGLMIMLIGGATKQADRLLHMDKVYDAEITLGVTSATGDAEGPLTPQEHTVPSETDINSSLQRFTGEITQTPSMYSAIKVGGQAAYKRARNGENVVVPSRSVTIKRISLEQYSYPRVKFEAEVTSGTYIRSLAQDVGINLNTGAYLSNLRRLSIGEYSLNDAHALDDINSQNVEACLFVLRSVS